jgi:hypothetical protein
MYSTCKKACDYGDGRTILHLLLPPNTPGFYIGAVDALLMEGGGPDIMQENEFLLPSGMDFRVVHRVEMDPNYCKSPDSPFVQTSRHIYAVAVVPETYIRRTIRFKRLPQSLEMTKKSRSRRNGPIKRRVRVPRRRHLGQIKS